jgi:ElaA protein
VSASPVATALHREWAADLTPERLYALVKLRIDVFVVEQQCSYQELDGHDLDQGTRHFWIASDQKEPVAYLRLLEERGGGFRIGRVCTAMAFRGTGLSRRLMEAALADAGDAEVILAAQMRVADLYEAYGFVREGDPYEEDGIPHIDMRRQHR